MNKVACEQAARMRALRLAFEADAVKPAQDAISGLNFGWSGLFSLPGRVQTLLALRPVVTQYGEDLRTVEATLDRECLTIPPVEPPPVEPPPVEPPPVEPPPVDPEPEVDPNLPALAEIEVAHPGTPTVLQWPVVDTAIRRVVVDEDDRSVSVAYKRLDEADWPYILRNGDPEYLGVLWMAALLPDGDGYECAPTEQLHTERERNGTDFTFEHVTDDGQRVPKQGELVGFFVCGPSRHMPDLPEYQRRGKIEWFVWDEGELTRYDRETYVPITPSTPPSVVQPPGPPAHVRFSWEEDYATVNSDAWLQEVTPAPTGRVKLRWKPWHPNVVPGTLDVVGDDLVGTYRGNEGWAPLDVGAYANLYFIMDVDGDLMALEIAQLVRPGQNTAFAIPDIWDRVEAKFGRRPEPGELCAWYTGNLTGDIRIDLYPWRS